MQSPLYFGAGRLPSLREALRAESAWELERPAQPEFPPVLVAPQFCPNQAREEWLVDHAHALPASLHHHPQPPTLPPSLGFTIESQPEPPQFLPSAPRARERSLSAQSRVLHESPVPAPRKGQDQPPAAEPAVLCCPFAGCGATARHRSKLARHVRTHTGEKPHKCTVPGCVLAFSEREGLVRHMRTHSGEKPFACGFPGCSRRFTESGNCRRHLRSHTGERPFACEYPGCHRAFSSAVHKRRHEASHVPQAQNHD